MSMNYNIMDEKHLLIHVATKVDVLCSDTKEIKETNVRQWEAINAHNRELGELDSKLDTHINSPHCGEDENEEIVIRIPFYKDKKRFSLFLGLLAAVIYGAIEAYNRLGV